MRRRRVWEPEPWVITLLVGIGLALLVIAVLESRLRPIVETVARTQAQNVISRVVEQAVLEDLARREMDYSDFVTIQRGENGAITALTTNMAQLNLLRTQLSTRLLEELEQIDVSQIQIPLGSLIDLDVLWGRGPSMQVHAMRVGTVSAEFTSQFSQAGINQTRHSIFLEIAVPLTLILPGGQVETAVQTRLCVAETVIVGQVPDTYLQMSEREDTRGIAAGYLAVRKADASPGRGGAAGLWSDTPLAAEERPPAGGGNGIFCGVLRRSGRADPVSGQFLDILRPVEVFPFPALECGNVQPGLSAPHAGAVP